MASSTIPSCAADRLMPGDSGSSDTLIVRTYLYSVLHLIHYIIHVFRIVVASFLCSECVSLLAHTNSAFNILYSAHGQTQPNSVPVVRLIRI